MIRRATEADAAAIGAVQVQSWQETYPGIVPDSYLACLDPAEKAALWRGSLARGGTVFVAANAQGIAGFGAAGPQRGAALPQPGEFYVLYVLACAQGRGLGRGLMAAMAGGLLAAGLRGAALWVIDGNLPALRFYTRLGGRLAGRNGFEIDGVPITETAYAWDDVSALLPE